jgi:hypothetical protein
MYLEFWWDIQEEREHCEVVEVGGRITLKRILDK